MQVCTYYYMHGRGKDPALLKNCLEYEVNRLILIYRYIKLILLVSQNKIAYCSAVEKSASLADIIHYVFQIEDKTLINYDVVWVNFFENAVKKMHHMNVKKEDNRTCWHTVIEDNRNNSTLNKQKQSDFQKLLVDVCYNFALESSIDGVYCAYDDSNREKIFVDAFVKRMDEYYDLYKDKVHYVNKAKIVELDEKDNLNWKRVVEIRKDILEYEKYKRESNRIKKLK